jgi:hypothetical protein
MSGHIFTLPEKAKVQDEESLDKMLLTEACFIMWIFFGVQTWFLSLTGHAGITRRGPPATRG